MNSGLRQIDSSVQKTIEWIKEVEEDLAIPRHEAYLATKAVLQVLRDRLPPAEAANLAEQLPLVMKGMFYEGFSVSPPSDIKTVDEFHSAVQDRLLEVFRPAPAEEMLLSAEEISMAVINMLERHVTAGEIRDIQATLPGGLQGMFGAAET